MKQIEPKEDKFWSFVYKNSFLLILTVRSASAYLNQIWDCDETYNYWEPLHFILYKTGFQTWEYSPEYSLRSYLYLYLHALPLWPFSTALSKINLFFMLRFIFALISSKIESDLFKSLINTHSRYEQIAKYYFLFTLTNVGMFLSSTSFLPSTFAMYMTMIAYSSWLQSYNRTAILAIGSAVLLGWPFAVLTGVPIAIDICFLNSNKIKNSLYFIKWTICFAVLIAVPLVSFDSFMFGKLVLAPLNIVLYNVFPSNANMGPDLYGREPFSYYFINCFLNFNFLSILCVMAPFLLCVDYFVIKKSKQTDKFYAANKTFRVISLAVCLWSLVFFTRPHKEERFLYPIYPLVLILASVCLNYLNLVFKKIKLFKMVPFLVICLHALLSLMRLIALLKNYSAQMDIYIELNKPQIKHQSNLETKELINVCVGKEWYRFPSSFFLPEDLDLGVKRQKWRLRFLDSGFKGQLPGYFNESVTIPLSTRYVDKFFNDLNKEVRQRYLDVKKCDFFMDTDNSRDNLLNEHLMLNKKNTKTKWKSLASLPFIDFSQSSPLFRSFYIPFLYEKRMKFTYFKLRSRLA